MEARIRIVSPRPGQARFLQATSWTATAAVNEVSSLQGDLPPDLALQVGDELALEVRGNESQSWSEPEKSRYIVTNPKGEQNGGEIRNNFTATEWVAYKGLGCVLRTTAELEWTFAGPIGLMVTAPFQDGLARGPLDGVDRSFNTTQTSSGADWAESATLTWKTDESYLGMLVKLQEQAWLRWTTSGHELLIENGGAGSLLNVWLPSLHHEKQRTWSESAQDYHNVVVATDDNGTVRIVERAPHPTFGRVEKAITVSGTTDAATVIKAANASLDAAGVTTALSVTFAFSDTNITPASVKLGNLVHVQDNDGRWMEKEITGWGIRFDGNAQDIDFSFGELPPDLAVLIAKRGRMLGPLASGNGRYSASGKAGEGLVEAWNGFIVDDYPGDGKSPRVRHATSGVVSAPLPFISGTKLRAGMPVQVVGGIVQGERVTDTNYPPIGIPLPLRPLDGWESFAEGLFGPPMATLYQTGEVVLQGALRPTQAISSPYNALLISEASFQPTANIRFGGASNNAWTLTTGGVLRAPGGSVGATYVLTGNAYNAGYNRTLSTSFAHGGIGAQGLAWFNGFKTTSGNSSVALGSLAPDSASNYFGLPLTATTYTVPSGSVASPAIAGGRFWRLPSSELNWEIIPLIDGSGATGTLRALKTATGIVLLTWETGSSVSFATPSRPVARLPQHLIPRWHAQGDSGATWAVTQRGEVWGMGEPLVYQARA